MKAVLIMLIFTLLCKVQASEESESRNEVEPRGKAKYALIIHFFYVVATKLIVLKMVYGALFYVLVTKGWQFVLWFIHYLKKHKHDHHEYIEDHHFDHYDHGHHDYSYGPPDHSYGPPSHSYGSSDHIYGPSDFSYGSSDHSYGYADHQPYAYDKYGGSKKKKIYDSDGSYAVKGH
ncbi:uncharacterized protein LOC124629609 [Helicoverpa zea]|uniref:uncharacterized protein LOC124629609 n=1 Tax=Helicoverpa zea TaxID=7113 RepID=UPI001F59EC07|nr:uncharacterized protein LOC124629609 [Helicoverpa zea]